MANSPIKENFSACISATSSHHLTDFRGNNKEYNLFREQIRKLLSESKIPKATALEIENTLMYQMGVESEFMYNRGIQDGITMINFLDAEYIDKLMFGITTELVKGDSDE